jgi:hypothetical protein
VGATDDPTRGNGDVTAAVGTTEEPIEVLDASQEDIRAAIADHLDQGLLDERDVADLQPSLLRPGPTIGSEILRHRLRILRAGCYLVSFLPRRSNFPFVFPTIIYAGTLRVETSGGARASGDLYRRAFTFKTAGLTSPVPNPAAGIPIFPRSQYRYYLRVTSLPWLTFGSSLTLKFRRHLFNHSTGTWTDQGEFSAALSWTDAPASYPDPKQFLSGPVRDASGVTVGTLSMAWVSVRLRRAVVEIDRVAASEAPMANAAGTETWASIGAKSGWRIRAHESDTDLTEPSGASWSNAELHAQLLASRDNNNLDREWRYVILAVRQLDATTRGIMFDAGATDSNNVPREGAAVASHWMIPDTPQWGNVRGQRFGAATDPYFRTAVHELGHALNLIHNESEGISGTTFMSTTPTVVGVATAADPFPGNITWDFHPDNKHRLRHWPDVYVRPGGRPFASGHTATPIVTDDLVEYATDLTVEVRPLNLRVPLGAPARLEVVLRNVGAAPAAVPASLRFEDGHVAGHVTGPSGVPHDFASLVRCVDTEETTQLAPGEVVTGSLTLLRGPDGPLFAGPGLHTIDVEIDWSVSPAGPMRATGRASILVDAPATEHEADAAAAVLAEPDLHVVVALGGGDHLTDGIRALDAGMASDGLRPHYAVTEALHAGRPFLGRSVEIDELTDAVAEEVVATADELAQLASVLEATPELTDEQRDGAVRSLRRAAAENPLAGDAPEALPGMLD